MDWSRILPRPESARYFIAAIAALLVAFDTFVHPFSAVSLALIAIGLSPWLITFVKTLELPGGLKVEFQERLNQVENRARAAGLITGGGALETVKEERSHLEEVYDSDPTLALAGLRISLERVLREIARIVLGQSYGRGRISQTLSQLREQGSLGREEYSAISDLIPLLNRAVHSEELAQEAADWAIRIGPSLIASLQKRRDSLAGKSAPE